MPTSNLRRLVATAAATLFAAATAPAPAQAPADEDVVQSILADISPQRIERRIRALAAFETRHTMSETESDTRGIGAARRWIERELRECSRAGGGALHVQMHSYVEPAGASRAPPKSSTSWRRCPAPRPPRATTASACSSSGATTTRATATSTTPPAPRPAPTTTPRAPRWR